MKKTSYKKKCLLISGNIENDCNFELTKFTDKYSLNSTSKHFKWLVHKGETASLGTGPKEDHTMGDGSGYYAYVDASYPANVNDSAYAQTTVASNPTGFCLSFWYHMYGPHVGALHVWEKVCNISSDIYFSFKRTIFEFEIKSELDYQGNH